MIFAHGVGSRGDLPLPLWQFSWAVVFALVASFIALGVLWREPRLAGAASGRRLVGGSALRVAEAIVRVVSFLLFALVLVAALFGTDSPNDNVAPVTIYVTFWIALQIFVALAGDLWSVASPFDTMGSALDRLRPAPTSAPPRWTAWAAPIGAFGFLGLELAHPSGDSPRILGVAIVSYSLVVMVAVWRWGRAWLRTGETFTVLFGLLGAMSPVHRDGDGALRFRWPLSGLAAVVPTMAATVLIVVVLGGTSFDGLGESEFWRDLVGRQSGWTGAAYRLFGLADMIAILGAMYLVGVRFMANATGRAPAKLASMFAPSLVPIMFGYAIAHYAQLLVDELQTFTFRLSDPLGRGWDLFGGADATIDFDVLSPDVIAWIQVIGIVLGHVAGVLVAHDRAITEFDGAQALRSQYAMLAVMVVYSVLGLWLLLNA